VSRIYQAIRRAEKQLKETRVDAKVSRQPSLEEVGRRKSIVANWQGRIPGSALNKENSALAEEGDPSSWEEYPVLADPKVVVISSPDSAASREFLALEQKLIQLRSAEELKTVLITSAVSSEGKTLTAVNLSAALGAEGGQKVLLIDANLRNPSVHRLLGIPAALGLSQLLAGSSVIDNVSLRTNLPGVNVIPAGASPENPVELLNTQKMQAVLSFAKKHFDWVLLDSPSILQHVEAELLSSFVDGVLLVVRPAMTSSDQLDEAVHLLRGKRNLGLVVNGTGPSGRRT
jgi:capsular exopolysaccharide synthesis family protein